MICPRCGKENSKEDRVCTSCGLKLKTICPRCKEPNKLGQPKCTKCNLTLIRFCPECKTPNFPHVKNCRKCGAVILKKKVKKVKKTQPAATEKQVQETKISQELPKEEVTTVKQVVEEQVVIQEAPVEETKAQEIQSEEPIKTPPPTSPQGAGVEKTAFTQENFKKEFSRAEAASYIFELINKSETGSLASICAPDGVGKTMLLSSLTQNTKEQEFIWLIGQCEPNKRGIPYSFFKDLFCTLFGIPVLITNKDEVKQSLKKTFESSLGIKDSITLNSAYKIILNEFSGYQSSIDENRDEIQNSIIKILNGLEKRASVIILAEDFEYIDKASFDAIKFILKQGFLTNKNFVFLNHGVSTNTAKLFPEEVMARKFTMIFLQPLSNEELNTMIIGMMNNQDILPENIKYKIFKNACGLPIYVEQALWFLFQIGAIYQDNQALKFNPKFNDVEFAPDYKGLLQYRLEMIENIAPEVRNLLLTTSLFGFKFVPAYVQAALGIEEQKLNEILQMLVNSGVLAVINPQTLAFKHVTVWSAVFEKAINDSLIRNAIPNVISILENNSETGSGFIAKLAENQEKNDNIVYYYKKAAEESYAMGDVLSYTDNQIRTYELIPLSGLSAEEKEHARLDISEKIGKVNYKENPSVAVKYLSGAIESYEKQGDNKVKLVDLYGYLSESAELTGDFLKVIECADKATIIADEDKNSLESVLMTFSKLDATFNLGRLQETIIMAQNDILPILNKAMAKKHTIPGLSFDDLKKIEYKTELILTKALIYQGNKACLEIMSKTLERAEKEKNEEYEVKTLLNLALFHVIQGDTKTCETILSDLGIKKHVFDQYNETKLQKLFITLIMNMITGNIEQARNICYSTLAFAKECRNYNIFAITKLLSGFFYQHFQYLKNAIAIYEEIANYSSETKMATSALYAWYLAAGAELQAGNIEKAKDIIEKAIDVSKKPNINNTLATIILSRLLAEIKIIERDFEGAHIITEGLITLADNNELNYLLVELYLSFGKMHQEKASSGEKVLEFGCNCANRLYKKASEVAEKIENPFLMQKAETFLTNLQTLCKLSGIVLE